MPNPIKDRRMSARDPLDHDPTRLRRRRVELGKSQAQVAHAVGISPSYMSELESGTRNPSPAVLGRLAEALLCATTDLMPAEPAATR
jgi:transcriptional regulator with XRE-family HTH domain